MPETSDYLILFGDLVGSTEVAVEAPPLFFARTYIASFHWAAQKALECVKNTEVFAAANFKQKIEEIKIAGDEVHAFIPLPGNSHNSDGVQDLVASAISFAYVTKLYWLAAPYNLRRMLGQQFPRDISVGIHIGRAAPVQDTADSDVAGLHINMTKRIESKARDAKESRIFASRDVTDLFEKWRGRYNHLARESRPPLCFTKFIPRREPISGKGVPKKLNVLELERAEQSEDLIYLFRQLATTPETIDGPAETAAKILAETFLPNNDRIFFETGLSVDNDIPQAQTADGYIEKWFEALDRLPKIFLDEPWLVFNCFFISCAMMRHPAVSFSKLELYKRIGDALLDRLLELIPRKS